MKKILAGLMVFGFLFIGSQVQASTLSDLKAEILSLKEEILSLRSSMMGAVAGYPTSDTTPRIMLWPGKVNQHVDSNGVWQTDADGFSGGWPSTMFPRDYGDRKVEYCNKFYSNIIKVEDYKNETINTWRNIGNTSAFTATRMSYKCIQGDASTVNAGVNLQTVMQPIIPSTIYTNSQIVFKANVTNVGDAVATNNTTPYVKNHFEIFNSKNEIIKELGNSADSITFMSPVFAGASKEITGAYSFTQTGTYSIKACGDQVSSVPTSGVIVETNEGDNCSAPVYFSVVTPTTPIVISKPVVTILSASHLSSTGATINAIASSPTAPITEKGFCYILAQAPTSAINGNCVKVAGAEAGPFLYAVEKFNGSPLLKNTSYRYVAYAVNSLGRTNSSELSFKIPSDGTVVTPTNSIPVVNQVSSKSVSATSQLLRVDIVSKGVPAKILEKGFCYNHNSQVSLEYKINCVKDTDANPDYLTSATATATELLPNTTYYYKGYAKNSFGVGYSEVGMFKTGVTVVNPTAGRWSEWSNVGSCDQFAGQVQKRTCAGGICAPDADGLNLARIIKSCNGVSTEIDRTPRVMLWSGKYNMYIDANGKWVRDTYSTTLGSLYSADALSYCKTRYPGTTYAQAYKNEKVYTWREYKKSTDITSTRQSYQCLGGVDSTAGTGSSSLPDLTSKIFIDLTELSSYTTPVKLDDKLTFSVKVTEEIANVSLPSGKSFDTAVYVSYVSDNGSKNVVWSNIEKTVDKSGSTDRYDFIGGSYKFKKNGKYIVSVCADNRSQVVESNEKNNCKDYTVIVGTDNTVKSTSYVNPSPFCTPFAFTRNMSLTSNDLFDKNNQVYRLQILLMKLKELNPNDPFLKFISITKADGIFGSNTKRAVDYFQSYSKLGNQTGNTGTLTRGALNSEWAKLYSSCTPSQKSSNLSSGTIVTTPDYSSGGHAEAADPNRGSPDNASRIQ